MFSAMDLMIKQSHWSNWLLLKDISNNPMTHDQLHAFGYTPDVSAILYFLGIKGSILWRKTLPWLTWTVWLFVGISENVGDALTFWYWLITVMKSYVDLVCDPSVMILTQIYVLFVKIISQLILVLCFHLFIGRINHFYLGWHIDFGINVKLSH